MYVYNFAGDKFAGEIRNRIKRAFIKRNPNIHQTFITSLIESYRVNVFFPARRMYRLNETAVKTGVKAAIYQKNKNI